MQNRATSHKANLTKKLRSPQNRPTGHTPQATPSYRIHSTSHRAEASKYKPELAIGSSGTDANADVARQGDGFLNPGPPAGPSQREFMVGHCRSAPKFHGVRWCAGAVSHGPPETLSFRHSGRSGRWLKVTGEFSDMLYIGARHIPNTYRTYHSSYLTCCASRLRANTSDRCAVIKPKFVQSSAYVVRHVPG